MRAFHSEITSVVNVIHEMAQTVALVDVAAYDEAIKSVLIEAATKLDIILAFEAEVQAAFNDVTPEDFDY